MIFALISISLNKGESTCISIPEMHVNITSDKETKTKTNPENKTLIKSVKTK